MTGWRAMRGEGRRTDCRRPDRTPTRLSPIVRPLKGLADGVSERWIILPDANLSGQGGGAGGMDLLDDLPFQSFRWIPLVLTGERWWRWRAKPQSIGEPASGPRGWHEALALSLIWSRGGLSAPGTIIFFSIPG